RSHPNALTVRFSLLIPLSPVQTPSAGVRISAGSQDSKTAISPTFSSRETANSLRLSRRLFFGVVSSGFGEWYWHISDLDRVAAVLDSRRLPCPAFLQSPLPFCH